MSPFRALLSADNLQWLGLALHGKHPKAACICSGKLIVDKKLRIRVS